MTRMERIRSIGLNIAVTAAIALILLWGNTLYRQWDQYGRGTEALKNGDPIAAIAGFEAAIHMYTPLSPLVERSATQLWDLAQQLERKGDPRKAVVAYRSLRSSFYAVHGLLKPGEDWIKRCDERIAALTGTPPPGR